ncbi:right-handed parallel beta-helix repeat-containing protein [Planococcus maritimus]|uniref:right-handed parallel beta-helix repeat-containing protein n=1 Tax=Planococcus maritimus TaxID=192421 RepID=UPI0007999792|nr:right-handed parallel beta-helix repeat-containing protein [Planococcus maritimus]KYG59339.1 hypothetical protein AY633_03595 [Planococcus maritimus]
MAFWKKPREKELPPRNKEDIVREMWSPKKTADQLFNVKSYGAIGDGKADDRKALQQAINAAYGTPKGGNLFFPPGLYRISGPIEVPEWGVGSAVSWIGHSAETTQIAPSEPMDYLVRMRGGSGSVKGIQFMGSDPKNGYTQLVKVCMVASEIRDKLFSGAAFMWGSVHGLQILEEGNNNLCVFDRLCQFSQNGSVIEGSGASGRGTNISFMKLDPSARDVHVGAYFKVGSGEGSVYHIDEVNTGSITVSPPLKKTISPGTAYQIHLGCGLQTDRGSDNNVYGIYDCHFVGNAATGLMVRGLYGHHIQGGNFDSNGIAGIHIGSGAINTTPAYSGSINHSYFENNGYANVLLDYASGLSIIEPLLAKPRHGMGDGLASITSLYNQDYQYNTTSILYNGRLHQYVVESGRSPIDMEDAPRITVNRKNGASQAETVKLPPAPTHKFNEEVEIFVEHSGGQEVRLICDNAKVNNKPGGEGVLAPAGIGYKITAFYNRNDKSWMVSHTLPLE